MKKGIKRMGIIVGVIMGLLTLIIGISFINHKIQLSKEDSIILSLEILSRCIIYTLLYVKGS
ncbi:hypothetical protein CPJCM30710_03090 [Clostridium polyendosporum]|uniref:Uncharacterized protein n=1 Tax=Clostridium polyendosporum TaxID=69208 RepID=A0A919RY17_9CLOT|nr:hypothetical protein [Clostridium polyendosporum]GIM27643.1 hypothetical protein CPJCM30710_03090 [Clostridium polyendosporum]